MEGRPALELDFVLIPDGEFVMGSDSSKDRHTKPDEIPAHHLHVSDFYLMRNPVTNLQYRLFVEATGHRPPLFWKDGKFPQEKANHPVVGVSFQDAVAFCSWAAEMTGLPIRLPTEPEWEKAARGSDGRLYPWGNEWKPGMCNSSEAKMGGTVAVGRFSPDGDSPFGIAGMGGNVQEWLLSIFGAYPYDPEDGREKLLADPGSKELTPEFYETGTTSLPESMEAALGKSTIRGGSWRQPKVESRCAYRSWAAPMHRSDDTGFRCCYEPD